jgi:hypothetical protein
LDISLRKRITCELLVQEGRRECDAIRARIEGRKPEKENLVIPSIRVLFPKAVYVMQPDKGNEIFLQKLSSVNINTMEEDKVKGIAGKTESGRRDEELPQLTIYTLEKVIARTFVRKLVEGEKFQNCETQKAPLVFKM